ncbi:restriction of telomere capping 1 [Gossypium australe]|uniref:Restriction of telomere capping 1 n=1 Tax=Gossypium australe TaxID=47621 RepID=A0A5B6VLZ6_9ROSI|nr:restriction of telomere capping 1 [Gossypium australe]
MLRVNRVINRARASISNCQYLLTCKQGKNRERTSKTIALANKILIPGIAARKFPAVGVIYSDGIKSKLSIVFDASGIDASKLWSILGANLFMTPLVSPRACGYMRYIFLLDKFGRIRWQGFGLAKQEEYIDE